MPKKDNAMHYAHGEQILLLYYDRCVIYIYVCV